jgi:FMN-dependent oxidoreductase (nitrilotriacetate monooxygenase family)
MPKRSMHLVGYLIAGPTWHHNSAWKLPGNDAVEALSAKRYVRLAKLMEEACFDGLFFVDIVAIMEFRGGNYGAVVQNGGHMFLLEPMQLLAAIAQETKHIGLAATMSTTFYHPFHIARAFATLDHISKGRAAWNIVTSILDAEARNFGMDRLPAPNERYDFADEVVEACQRLWDSWDADAIVLDPVSGIYADPARVHRTDFEGRWIKARGPLPTPRSPQGHPVFMQAGASDRGRDFAARWAEVVFTLQHSKADMLAYTSDIKARMARYNRRPEHCAVLPSIDVVIGETESIARERAAYLDGMVNVPYGITEIGNATGNDLSSMPGDTPVERIKFKEGASGMLDVILQAGGPSATLLDTARRFGSTRMTPQIVGTATMIADYMQEVFEAGCCDGFVVCPAMSPGMYIEFCRTVVPELQRRGIFRTAYEGRTFRENLRGIDAS